MDSNTVFILRFLTFAILHSILAVPALKERIRECIGLSPSAYRLGYTMVSLPAFAWVMGADRDSLVLYEVAGGAGYLLYMVQAVVAASLVYCLLSTGVATFFGFDLFRNGSINVYTQTLVTTGWYRIVRHPLYLLSLLFMVANPVMTTRWLTLMALSTAYFLIGALVEEKRLLAEFGDEYRRYRETVPFIVPNLFKRPVL